MGKYQKIILLTIIGWQYLSPAFADIALENNENVINCDISNNENESKEFIPVAAFSSDSKIEEMITSQKSLIAAFDLVDTESQDSSEETRLESIIEQNDSNQKFFQRKYMTGDWLGYRTNLENHGVTISSSYRIDNFMKLHGGAVPQNIPQFEGQYYLAADLDTEKLHLWKNGRFYLNFINNAGHGISQDVGDFQLVNAYDYDPFTSLIEYWYEHKFWDNKLKLKTGRQDINFDFIYMPAAQEFANGGFYTENVPLPTYPNTTLGLAALVQPKNWIALRTGFFDGKGNPAAPLGIKTAFDGQDGYLAIGEVNLFPEYKSKHDKYLFGSWINTTRTVSLNTEGFSEDLPFSYGIYSGFEQMLFRENKSKNDDQGLSLIGQYAWAPEKRRDITQFYALALSYKGIIPKRNQDILGAGFNIVIFSKNFSNNQEQKTETVVEVFYKAVLTPWLSFRTDFQYIGNPSGIYKDAFTLGFTYIIIF